MLDDPFLIPMLNDVLMTALARRVDEFVELCGHEPEKIIISKEYYEIIRLYIYQQHRDENVENVIVDSFDNIMIQLSDKRQFVAII